MNQQPRYVTTSEGKVARVIHSNDFTDYYLWIRWITNIEKKEVAHELVDILGDDICSDVLNEIIDFLEQKLSNKKVKRVKHE